MDLAAKTIEIIEKPEYLLNYMFIIKQLSHNVHNFVQFKRFTIINPFPLTQKTLKKLQYKRKTCINE